MTTEQAQALGTVVCRMIDYFHASRIATEMTMATGRKSYANDPAQEAILSHCEESGQALMQAFVDLPEGL